MKSDTHKLTAEVVSIGDEMTNGARLDTNAQWLSQRLEDLGVEVAYHSTVGDELSRNIDVFQTAARHADVVVATGGLGPTRDDLTREALAAVVDQPLELREGSLQHIQDLFAKRNREMPARNEVQAMFPVGSTEIFNPQGTAPGIDLPVDGDGTKSRVFALPGVPAEMKRMFDESVAPRILEMSGGANCIEHAVMKFFGAGESDMEHQLGDMISRDRHPRVGITVSQATISLRITAMGETSEDCTQQIMQTREQIMQLVGELHFGDGENFEQYHAIDSALKSRGESLLVIELGMAAPLGDWFASLGKTPAYRGGLSFACSDDVMQLVASDDLTAALELLRERFEADWILMIDEYPSLKSPDGGPLPAQSVRLVVIRPDGERLATKTVMGGHPAILQQRIAKAGMAWLRKVLGRM